MAGNQNSGGMRPTAPQNNPANVSATGGNGQSGQPKRYMPGLPYGSGGNMQQQAGAPMAQSSAPTGGAHNLAPIEGALSGMTPLDAPPADPTIPVSHGVNVGRGGGEEVLPTMYQSDRRPIENIDLIKKYLPDLINATRVQNAPDSYKRFVNYLKNQVM